MCSNVYQDYKVHRYRVSNREGKLECFNWVINATAYCHTTLLLKTKQHLKTWQWFRCIVPFTELKKNTCLCVTLFEETTWTTNVRRTRGSGKYLDINSVQKMWENLKQHTQKYICFLHPKRGLTQNILYDWVTKSVNQSITLTHSMEQSPSWELTGTEKLSAFYVTH
jgi:hypothetical protein